MDYSDFISATCKMSGAPTRDHDNGAAVVTPRPKTRAADLLKDYLILAFPQDLFARALNAHAPLAGRFNTALLSAGLFRPNLTHP